MARTNYHVYWFTFHNGWNTDGTPIILTAPAKGVSLGDAESRLKRGWPHARMIGQATEEDKMTIMAKGHKVS